MRQDRVVAAATPRRRGVRRFCFVLAVGCAVRGDAARDSGAGGSAAFGGIAAGSAALGGSAASGGAALGGAAGGGAALGGGAGGARSPMKGDGSSQRAGPPPIPLPSEVLDRFAAWKGQSGPSFLKRGRQAEVWKAFDRKRRRPVALKIFTVEGQGPRRHLTLEDASNELFAPRVLAAQRECRVAQSMQRYQRRDNESARRLMLCHEDHTRPLPSRQGGALYLVLEFCGDLTLDEWLERRWSADALTIDLVGHVWRQLQQGLTYLTWFRHKWVHRALDPSNIAVLEPQRGRRSRLPELKIIDFGTVVEVDSKFATEAFIDASAGSVDKWTVPPEFWFHGGGTVSRPWSSFDAFSAASVLVTMLAGRPWLMLQWSDCISSCVPQFSGEVCERACDVAQANAPRLDLRMPVSPPLDLRMRVTAAYHSREAWPANSTEILRFGEDHAKIMTHVAHEHLAAGGGKSAPARPVLHAVPRHAHLIEQVFAERNAPFVAAVLRALHWDPWERPWPQTWPALHWDPPLRAGRDGRRPRRAQLPRPPNVTASSKEDFPLVFAAPRKLSLRPRMQRPERTKRRLERGKPQRSKARLRKTTHERAQPMVPDEPCKPDASPPGPWGLSAWCIDGLASISGGLGRTFGWFTVWERMWWFIWFVFAVRYWLVQDSWKFW